jgi:hypothetical protein
MSKQITALFILTIFLISNTNLRANPSKIEVFENTIENIDVKISYGNFVSIDLDNEIQGLININNNNMEVRKLNNKSIIIYLHNNNVPLNVGKIIISDSACNKYSINVVLDSNKNKTQQDTAIYIKNSNNSKTCETADNKNSGIYPRVGSVKYSS